MKTIEQKAKAYDKAIKVAADIKAGTATYITDGTPVVDAIFPELKESEDERIRKFFINFAEHYVFYSHEGFTKNDAIAWLEKQGEQKSIEDIAKEVVKDKDSAISFLKSAGIMDENGELAKPYRSEQESVEYSWKGKEMGYYEDIRNILRGLLNNERYTRSAIEADLEWLQLVKPQKPVIEMKTPEESLGISSEEYNKIVDECIYGKQNPSWSEEDKKNINLCIKVIKAIKEGKVILKGSDGSEDELISWLKSLKDRVLPQLNQSKSGEDKKHIETISLILEDKKKEQTQWGAGVLDEEIAWLKSLHPQNTWKPSDEQMEALTFACIKNAGIDKSSIKALYDLKEQLKKLK